MKFLFHTRSGEILDLAIDLQNQSHEVVMHITDKNCSMIGNGIIEKTEDWYSLIGKGYIWVFDGCEYGPRQDWLRLIGENVFGGSKEGDRLENERQLNQKWFKATGFDQPPSKNFKDIDSTLQFVIANPKKKWILKQNADAPKSLNYKSEFEGNVDLIYHLEGLKKKWNEQEFGQFDVDLMEVVEGLEVAASLFFNGKDFLRNSKGKIVGYLNFEEKKETDGGLGETTGEMGTTFIGVDEDNHLFRNILLRPKILEVLRSINFRGVFDINTIVHENKITALEPTMRFGIPATSYEFIEAMHDNAEVITALAQGRDISVNIEMGVGMVMVIATKPFPVEEVPTEETSQGEKLWILNKGMPINDFTKEQKKHIHLYNFQKKDNDYLVASKDGYLLTVTGRGNKIKDTREKLIQYIKDNLFISGMKYRQDIGKRVEDYGNY